MNLIPFTTYSYRVESFNSEGNTNSKPSLISINLPSQPCCMFEYQLLGARSSRADLRWTMPERSNGINLQYFIKVFIKQDKYNKSSKLIEQLNSSIVLDQNQLKNSFKNYFQVNYNLIKFVINSGLCQAMGNMVFKLCKLRFLILDFI